MDQDPYLQLRQYQALCKKALEHVRIKLVKQELEFSEANKCSWYKEIGDSLLAHPDLYSKGAVECIIENIHSHEIESVATNPKFNAFQNAQLFYKKARKGKRSLEIVEKKVSESKKEIKRLEDLHEEIEALEVPAITPEAMEKGLEKVFTGFESSALSSKMGTCCARARQASRPSALPQSPCSPSQTANSRKQCPIAITRLKAGTFTSVKTIFKTTN